VAHRRRAAEAVTASVAHPPTFQIDPAVRVTTHSSEGCLLMHVETLRTCVLNAVGTRIWSLLAEGRAVEDITVSLSRDYDAQPSQIAGDVRAFLDVLLSKGFLTRSDRSDFTLQPTCRRG
jgi:hypothetical protein